MFNIINFQFSYPGRDLLINNFNLALEKGKKYVILGENGVGKSSVMRAIWERSFLSNNEINFPISKAYLSQDIPEINNFNPHKITESFYDLLYQIEINSQTKNIKPDNWDEIVLNWYLDTIEILPTDFNQRLKKYLSEFNLVPSQLAKKYSLLSPGTKKKILIAILFSTNPDIILLDEITNHLDSDSVMTVKNWIIDYTGVVLMIEHNNQYLNALNCEYIVIPNNQERIPRYFPNMTLGEVVEQLEAITEIQQLQEEQVALHEKKLKDRIKLIQKQASMSDVNLSGAMGNAKKRLIREVDNNPIVAQIDYRSQVRFQKPEKRKSKQNIILKIRDLEFIIGDDKKQYIPSFELYGNEKVLISGENGTGKSTLLKLISASLYNESINPQFISGEITLSYLDNQNIFFFNQATNYGDGLSIENFVHSKVKMVTGEIKTLLKTINLNKFDPSSDIAHLSLGEFIRLQLAIFARISNQIDLLILDEPGNFLDIFTQNALVNLLQNYGGALLLVTHDSLLSTKIGYDRVLKLS